MFQTWSDLTFNKHVTKQLLALSEDLPHLLWHGPVGSGKRTRIAIFLRHLFGTLTIQSVEKADGCIVFESNHHIEMSMHQKASIKGIDSICQTKRMVHLFLIILHDCDCLPFSDQHSLLKLVERCNDSCYRFILITNHIARLITPIRSRFVPIRFAKPTLFEISKELDPMFMKSQIKCNLSKNQVAFLSNRDLRRAPFIVQQNAPLKWQQVLISIVKLIFSKQFPLESIEQKLHGLLDCCIPPSEMFRFLEHLFSQRLNGFEVIQLASEYEYRCSKGREPIFHLQAFFHAVFNLVVENHHSPREKCSPQKEIEKQK